MEGSTTESTGNGETSSSTNGTTGPTTNDLETTIDPDTTATAEDTGPPEPCVGDDECRDAMLPFCSPQGECVDCSGMPDPHEACTSVEVGLPVCLGGLCVECSSALTEACDGTTPICDPTSNVCVACTEHAQCGAAACNLFTGACLPEDAVVSVGAGQDYATLAAAVATVPAGGAATILVYDNVIYNEAVTVGSGRVVAFLASPGAEPEWQRTTGAAAPQLTASNGATVLLEGLVLRNNGSSTNPKIDVIGASAWVDRGYLVQSAGSAGGALRANNAEVVLRNSFLNAGNNRIVLEAQGSTVDVLYSTLAANFGASTAITCDMPSLVRVRDSILVSLSADPEVACDLDVEHTASELALVGTGNVDVGNVMESWFASYTDGDYHLTIPGEAVFAAIAQWDDGDPLVDIDNQARAGVDGTPEHAGADRP